MDANPALVPASAAPSYQSTSDSADSPITSPGAAPCHSPTDHLINGNIASPPQTVVTSTTTTNATSNVLIMRDLTHMDEDSYQMAFKQEPNVKTEQHTF